MSSKPTTETSSGTRRPPRSSRSISAIAITSLVQQTAVGAVVVRHGRRGRGGASAAASASGRRSTDSSCAPECGEGDALVAEAGRGARRPAPSPRTRRRAIGAQARGRAPSNETTHDRDAAVEQLRRDRRARRHRREDHAVDAPADERPHLRRLGRRIVLGLGDEHGEAVAVGAPLDLQGDGGVERVQRVGDDDPERARGPPLERARDLVLAVAELVDRRQHARPGRQPTRAPSSAGRSRRSPSRHRICGRRRAS